MADTRGFYTVPYPVACEVGSRLRDCFSISQNGERLHGQVGLCQPQAQSRDSSSIAWMSQVPAR